MKSQKIHIDGVIFSLQKFGGITVYFRELLSYLTGKKILTDLSIELPASRELSDLPPGLNVNVRRARTLERFRSCRVADDVSVFHSSYYRQPARRGIPTVVTVHDFIYERFRSGPARWTHVWQKHSAIRQAQAIICISDSTKDDLLNFVGVRSDQTVHVIPNGVGSTFMPATVVQPTVPFVIYVGERSGYKNFALVLNSLAHLPDLELHCVGGGPLREEELTGCSLSVRSRVIHLGFITDETLNIVYNQAVCLIYPSLYEGFGIPVVESMKAGCPVVSVDCKAVIEVGADALEIVRNDDPQALADAVNRLREPFYRAKKISQGLMRASLYSWARCHEDTLKVYSGLSLDDF